MVESIALRSLSPDGRLARQTALVGLVVLAGILVALLSWHTTLLLTFAIIGVVLGAVRPDLALATISLSVPLQQNIEVGIQSGSLTVTKVLLWTSVVGWSVSLLMARRRVQVDLVTVGLLLVVAALVVSVWNARDGGLWIGETYRWFATAVVSLFAFNVFRRGGSPIPFLLSGVAGTFFVVIIASWQVIRRIGPTSYENHGLFRAFGPFGHPNQLAIYLELTAPMFLALAILSAKGSSEEGRWFVGYGFRWVWYLALAAAAFGLIQSQSRGGAVGIIAGLGAVLLLSRDGIRPRLATLAPLALIGLLVVLTIGVAIVAAGVESFGEEDVLVTPANFAVRERLAHWTAAVEMAKDYPVAGVGAGNYDLNFRAETQDWRFRIGRGHAHNTYLHMLAQAGVLGITAYLSLLLGVALVMSRTIRGLVPGSRMAIMIGAAGVTASMLAHAVFEYVHVLSLSLHLAITWALATAIGTEVLTERNRRDNLQEAQ